MLKPFPMFRRLGAPALARTSSAAINCVADTPAHGWQLDGLAVGVPGGGVLACIDAHIATGRLTAIVGPNGAGKSSLLAILTGQRQPHGGQLRLDGQPLTRWHAPALAQRRAMMMQDGAVAFDFTVREVVELGRYAHRLHPSRNEAAIVDQALAITQMQPFANRSVRSLSGGERARAHLARVLAQVWEPPASGQARWLLLDEPTAAMDLAWQHRTLVLLRHWAWQGVGVLIVVHDMNLALRYADDVLLMHGGGCRHGPAADVLTPQVIGDVWGVGCCTAWTPDGVPQYLFQDLRQ